MSTLFLKILSADWQQEKNKNYSFLRKDLHNFLLFIMRPDRIVVGEVRGEEALDMLQAMNTGHDGSLSTGHANSPEGMISRLETMVLTGSADLPLEAIRMQIASAVDYIVHLSRLRDFTRKVMEVCEVVEYRDGKVILNPIYKFEEDEHTTLKKVSGALKRTKNPIMNQDKFVLAGIYDFLEDKKKGGEANGKDKN